MNPLNDWPGIDTFDASMILHTSFTWIKSQIPLILFSLVDREAMDSILEKALI